MLRRQNIHAYVRGCACAPAPLCRAARTLGQLHHLCGDRGRDAERRQGAPQEAAGEVELPGKGVGSRRGRLGHTGEPAEAVVLEDVHALRARAGGRRGGPSGARGSGSGRERAPPLQRVMHRAVSEVRQAGQAEEA